jgi:hypothetical protein
MRGTYSEKAVELLNKKGGVFMLVRIMHLYITFLLFLSWGVGK